ncbi:hypothetical protein LZ32DRAFT_100847 [Colletotrichum eremochloae]|nr:hypothetical protein LZ32DRAFT_100847 [Colletotrichum eremochloae]
MHALSALATSTCTCTCRIGLTRGRDYLLTAGGERDPWLLFLWHHARAHASAPFPFYPGFLSRTALSLPDYRPFSQ